MNFRPTNAASAASESEPTWAGTARRRSREDAAWTLGPAPAASPPEEELEASLARLSAAARVFVADVERLQGGASFRNDLDAGLRATLRPLLLVRQPQTDGLSASVARVFWALSAGGADRRTTASDRALEDSMATFLFARQSFILSLAEDVGRTRFAASRELGRRAELANWLGVLGLDAEPTIREAASRSSLALGLSAESAQSVGAEGPGPPPPAPELPALFYPRDNRAPSAPEPPFQYASEPSLGSHFGAETGAYPVLGGREFSSAPSAFAGHLPIPTTSGSLPEIREAPAYSTYGHSHLTDTHSRHLASDEDSASETSDNPMLADTGATSHPAAPKGARHHLCSWPGCGKSFPTPSHLRRHERSHNGEKPFECAACGKRFSRNDNARKHAAVHLGGAKAGRDDAQYEAALRDMIRRADG